MGPEPADPRNDGGHSPSAMPPTLGSRTLSGLGWLSVGTSGQVVLKILVLAILARALTPQDFGIVAAALIVINLSLIVAEVGLGPALIQRAELSTDHIRVAFTVLVLTGAGFWLLTAAAAPLLADLFRIPELTPVLRVMALAFFLRNLTVSDFLLQREMQFRKVATVQLTTYAIAYCCVGIPMAFLGAGPWTIVGAHLSETVLAVGAYAFLRPHPVRPLLRRDPMRDLLSYGGGSTLSKMTQAVATQSDNFIVGRWLGPSALGLYGRAYQLMSMPAILVGQILRKVLFPAMSAVQRDAARVRTMYETGSAAIALVVLPLSVIAALMSRELILLLLGPDWLGLQAAFNVMVFGMLFRASHPIADAVLQATGAVYQQAARKGAYAVLVIVGALVGQRWGIAGVAVGVLVAIVVNFLLLSQLAMSVVDLSWRRFLSIHSAALVLAAFAGAATAAATAAARVAQLPGVLVIIAGSTAALAAVVMIGRFAPALPGLGGVATTIGAVHDSLGAVLGARARPIVALFGPRYADRVAARGQAA